MYIWIWRESLESREREREKEVLPKWWIWDMLMNF